jgi:hypothetical protein
LFGNLERIIDFDPEIPDSACEFGMPEEKLNSPAIPCPPKDQCRLRAAK